MKKLWLVMLSSMLTISCAANKSAVVAPSQENDFECKLSYDLEFRIDTFIRLKSTLIPVDLNNPVTDAHKHVDIGDTRFLAIDGEYGLEIPGLSTQYLIAPCKYGLSVIALVTDAYESEEHLKLLIKIDQYAARYNQALMLLLDKKHGN